MKRYGPDVAAKWELNDGKKGGISMKIYEFGPAGVPALSFDEVELRHWQAGGVAKWWHKPIVWVHRKLWPRFVLCIPDGKGGGDIYYQGFLTASVIRHEAGHCIQALGRFLRFAFGYIAIPGRRLEDEAFTYSESLAYLSHAKTFEELFRAVTVEKLADLLRSKRGAYLWPVIWDHRVSAGVKAFYRREYARRGYRVTYIKKTTGE
jgi:hypothetical protein